MKIIHLSTYDLNGGAAQATYRLHQGLRKIGQDSTLYVLNKQSRDTSVKQFEHPHHLTTRIRRRLDQTQINRDIAPYHATRPVGLERFSDDRSVVRSALMEQIQPTDIINLHWVAGFVNYQAFFPNLLSRQPIVWTLHDMNPLTGGCHYDGGCCRYQQRCGPCPQLGSRQVTDLSQKIWRRKAKALSYLQPEQLHVVTPSRWLADQVRQSPIFSRFAVSTIPNSVDVSRFKPYNRMAVRELLDIPQDAKVLLFIADSVNNKRKGLAKLQEAIHALMTYPNLFLLSAGTTETMSRDGIRALHLGNIQDERFLATVYSAADLFVIPSLEDNLPNTVLEAMACGVPVVGFNVGGIPDMVRPNITGLLASPGNAAELGQSIATLLTNSAQHNELANNCRRVAVEEYSLEVQAQRYVKLYEEMIEKSHG